MKIAIASAGRRAHYVQWFKEALVQQGISGEVIALEFRADSATFGLADRTFRTPAYNSPEYPDLLLDWSHKERPDLFLCLNDYELQVLSQGLAEELRALGCLVPILPAAAQALVLDKYQMSLSLSRQGIPTPTTWLGSAATQAYSPTGEFIVKHRFGSGSTGLQRTTAANLPEAVSAAAGTALNADGKLARGGTDYVIVQEYLPGPEYGVDGVFSLDGTSRLLGVLARRVEKMRDGDPDVATTVPAEQFQADLARLGDVLLPSGSLNVDFRENQAGETLIIDINPRLGGGYPYCHRAGADLPSALVRLAAGLDHDPSLLDYQIGVTTARHEDFTVISHDSK